MSRWTDKTCLGVEIEEKFEDVAVKRYIQFKGGSTENVYVTRDGVNIPYDDLEIEVKPPDE